MKATKRRLNELYNVKQDEFEKYYVPPAGTKSAKAIFSMNVKVKVRM